MLCSFVLALAAPIALQGPPDAGLDQIVTFPAPATLAGSLPGARELSWFTADGNNATEDMLVGYDDTSGQVGVGTLTDGLYVYGWLGDIVDIGGVAVGNGVLEQELFSIDLSTGACSVIAPAFSSQYTSVHSMAYDAGGDRLFAVNANTRQLLRIDHVSGVATKVGNASLTGYPVVRALAYEPVGDLLYAIDQQTDSLFTIDPATGATTFLVKVAQVPGYRQEELQFDNGTLFLNLGIEDGMGNLVGSQLNVLDPLTGVLTPLGPELTEVSGHCLYLDSVPDSLQWTQVSGPGLASFDDDTSATPVVTLSAPGAYLLQLEAFDFYGASLGVDTVTVTSAGWEPFCSGDGSGTACPCGNVGGPGEGCANSTGLGGLLINSGGLSVSGDDTVLEASQLPAGKSAIFFVGAFQKNGGLGTPFGDGLRCVQGPPLRRYPFNNTGTGVMTQPSVAGLSLGLITPGSTWYFQAWHRDAATVCGNQTNLTNAIGITFAP